MAPPATTSSSSAAARPAAPWRTGCPPTRPTGSWCSRPAAPTTRGTSSSTCRPRCTFPIGSRFYDWKYESEPEPHMNGRRIYHARGKVLGGSSSINGMIFQRGNPLDYERWARRPGHGRLGLRALPAVLQAHGELPGRRRPTTRSAGTTARSCWSAARPRTRCSRRSSRPCSRPATRCTDDVNGYRQEGFAPFDRNIHRGRRLSAARAYLHPVMSRPNLDGHDPGVRHADPLRGHARRRRRVPARPRHRSGSGPARSSCAAARSTPRSCCSCPASATPTS